MNAGVSKSELITAVAVSQVITLLLIIALIVIVAGVRLVILHHNRQFKFNRMDTSQLDDKDC